MVSFTPWLQLGGLTLTVEGGNRLNGFNLTRRDHDHRAKATVRMKEAKRLTKTC